jgi:hypothetical protein
MQVAQLTVVIPHTEVAVEVAQVLPEQTVLPLLAVVVELG